MDVKNGIKVKKSTSNGKVKSYTFDEALKASTAYFSGDSLAANVWVNKYAMKDSSGRIYEKTPDDMHWRLANEIARADANFSNPLPAEDIYDALKNFKYIIPQGSPDRKNVV